MFYEIVIDEDESKSRQKKKKAKRIACLCELMTGQEDLQQTIT